MHKIALLTAAFLALPATMSEAAETIIGRWCDTVGHTWRREMTIKVKDDNSVVVKSTFADGSSLEQLLTEGSKGLFLVNNKSGDRYRVVPSTGELQLIDNDGLHRIAKRLENEPQTGDCI